MKITALEIRKKSFEKNFRGYDKEEVDAFMSELSTEWEKLVAENEELQRKLDQSNKEATKLKEVEASLFRTLKTAEDTGASIIEEANEAADHIVNEAHQNAEAMLNDAKTQSRNLIDSAESKGKQIMAELKGDVSDLVNGYESLIHQRELILKNLKKLAEDIEDNISMSNNDIKKVNVKVHQEMVETLNKNNAFTIANINDLKEEEMVKHTLVDEIDNLDEAPVLEQDEEEIIENTTVIQEDENLKEDQEEVSPDPVTEPQIKSNQEIEEPEEDKNKGNKNRSFFDDID
ncbi:DivIVA domain-containing protein [Belliella sp. R4-6]|uniref:DivIVA domain-containing protein n=1 Tax=Belliella alkalica TaxID=1730871 RepID=A0ABS9VAV7_9BACT|nr:DivIVA domain-containing protein [Belliella alkalica]MCH7413564.1 DivIVA domain-containing protein [Belliella alkalica]